MAESTLFPTTVVGSMPRPQFVRDLLRPETRKALGEKEFTRRLDLAVAFVVAMQEATGVDIISDGEWRRLSYIGVIADICDGFEVGYRGDQPWTVVVDKITARAPGIVKEVLVQEGDKVVEGQILARQEDDDSRLSRNRVAAQLSQAEAQLPILEVQLEAAIREEARLKRLTESDAASTQAYEQAQDRTRQLQAQVEAQRTSIVVMPDFVGRDPMPRAPGACRQKVVNGGGGDAAPPVGKIEGQPAPVGLAEIPALDRMRLEFQQ